MLNKMNKILDFVRENKEFEYSISIEENRTKIQKMELVLVFGAYRLEITYYERQERVYLHTDKYYDKHYITLETIDYHSERSLGTFYLDNADLETIKEYLLLEQKIDKAREELNNSWVLSTLNNKEEL